MSSDYRPRGGSSSGGSPSSGRGGPRRRRGGRGRGGPRSEGATGGSSNRLHTNGTSPAKPAAKENPIAKFFGWLTGKKKNSSSEIRPSSPRSSISRSEISEKKEIRSPRENRPSEPRAERPRREEQPKAEPILQEIVSPKLYVGNLAYEAAESDLFDLFSKVGAVKNVEIAMDRHANRSKGFGFVEMEALETAKTAAEKLNRTDFMGRQIVVSGAKLDRRPVNPREADATPDVSPDASI